MVCQAISIAMTVVFAGAGCQLEGHAEQLRVSPSICIAPDYRGSDGQLRLAEGLLQSAR